MLVAAVEDRAAEEVAEAAAAREAAVRELASLRRQVDGGGRE